MKKIIKQCLCMIMAMCSFISMLIFDVSLVNAADEKFSTNPSKGDSTFYVSYDTSKYQIYWISRRKITSKSQYGSMWWDLDEGDTLGTATIRVYYLEPKTSVDGKYYAIAGCQVSMDPQDVAGDVTGMSQLVDFRIKTKNPDSRVCSPTVQQLDIQASKSYGKQNSFTAGTGLKYNSEKRSWEASVDLSFGKTWGSTSTYTYNMTNVNLVQKNKNGEYASWKYDYKSKTDDAVWNAYLMSSSKVAGQVVYRLNSKPTNNLRSLNVPSKIYYDIRFGAGDSVTGEVADRLGPSTNRDMSIKTGTFTISY